MEKRPLIICTDPGIDDFIALSMLLHRPEFDILGIICISGNVGLDITVNNALLACELNGREDVPVIAGSAKPLCRPAKTAHHIHGNSGLGKSVERYSSRTPIRTDAAAFIADAAKRLPGKLEVLSLGPLTDVAVAIDRFPEIRSLFRSVLVMGGGISRGNATKYAEFNIVADPEAAEKVYSSGSPIVMVGLDATHQCVLPRDEIAKMSADSDLGHLVPAMLNDYADIYHSVHHVEGLIIHDAITAVYLYHPEWFRSEQHHVDVLLTEDEHLGQTMIDDSRAVNCTVCLGCDSEKVNGEIVRAMQSIVKR